MTSSQGTYLLDYSAQHHLNTCEITDIEIAEYEVSSGIQHNEVTL